MRHLCGSLCYVHQLHSLQKLLATALPLPVYLLDGMPQHNLPLLAEQDLRGLCLSLPELHRPIRMQFLLERVSVLQQ